MSDKIRPAEWEPIFWANASTLRPGMILDAIDEGYRGRRCWHVTHDPLVLPLLPPGAYEHTCQGCGVLTYRVIP